MALQDVVIPIDFGGGVDTKTDPKLVVPGKMLRIENGVFTSPKRIAKRYGYTGLSSNIVGGGTLSAPKMNHGYNNELLCADSGSLYSWVSSSSKWKNVGNYVSTELTKNTVNQDFCASGYADSAVLGNYILYGWSTAAQRNSLPVGSVTAYSSTYCSIVDSTTGAILLGPTLLTTDLSGAYYTQVRCVTLGGSVLAILYMKADFSAVQIQTVSFAGGVPTLSVASSITTGFNIRQFVASSNVSTYDVVQTVAGASIIYGTAAGIRIDNINTSGTSSANLAIADAAAMGPYHICQNSNGNLWFYWCDETDDGAGHLTANNIVYAVYSSTLVAVQTKTIVKALSSPYIVSNMISVPASTTQHTLYYGIYISTATGKYADQTRYITQTSAGVIGSDTWYTNGAIPYSRYFTDNSINYAVFMFRSSVLYPLTLGSGNFVSIPGTTAFTSQATGFVIKLSSSPVVVSRFGSGNVGSQAVFQTAVAYNPSVMLLTGNKYVFSVAEQVQEFASDYFITQEFFTNGLQNNFSYYFDFNSDNAYRATNAGQLAILNGGIIQNYDGRSSSEFGFHFAPEITSLVESNTASGSIANGLYSYLAIFQWTDNQGNFHQSAPSIPASITTTGVNDTVTIKVSNYFLTQKTGVNVAIYRTAASGSIYYLITDPIFVQSASDSSSGATTTFTDYLVTSSITGNPEPYTFPASSVLENSTPPPSMALLAHNNRLFFRDDENPNTVWYTKSFSPGTGLSPSGFMTEDIDPKFGNIAALAEMDDKFVIIKKNGVFVQSGDGVNDVGSGSTFSFPQFVPSDVGCDQLKSVISSPMGVMFHSPNGIYILTRSLAVEYIGMDVESYNSQTITSANLVPGKSQIRFLVSSGYTLVFDYIFGKWATFTNHTGYSATTWNSTYVYATTGGVVFQESTSYTDNGTGYNLLVQTSWLALAGVQGFQRAKRLIMLGDFVNGASASHKMQIQLSYDFSSTLSTAVPFTFGAALATGPFEYREVLARQKCAAVSLLIQEVNTADSSEYIDFTNISFEAGIKKGVNKLGGLQSVG